MDVQARLSMSFYETVATISEDHRVYMVRHSQTGQFYIKKILDIYNKDIYSCLMTHPIDNIPKIYELYEEDGQLTVIEEYKTGDTLESLLERGRRFTDAEIEDIVKKLCCILSSLHNYVPSIIHRDIKPSNIIIGTNGEVYLLDFNAAKYVSTGKNEDTTLLGTKGYAAPEQYGFGTSNVQTDIYALGMVINTLVNGTFSATPVNSKKFGAIIKKCTEMNPRDRYESADDIIKALKSNRKKLPDITSIQKEWMTYLPPGFRTLNADHMLVASSIYLFCFYVIFTLQVKDSTPFSLLTEKLFLAAIFLMVVAITCDYRGMQELSPLCNVKNKYLRILGVIVTDILVTFLLLIAMFSVVMIIS